MIQKLRLRKADDLHLHLRQGALLEEVLQPTIKQCARALVMPNIMPPVLSAEDLLRYRAEILAKVPGDISFEPLMTFKLREDTSAGMVTELAAAGAVAGKLYPVGVTTNAADGVSNLEKIYPVLERMQALNLVLCIHGEEPGEFCLDRERAYLSRLDALVREFPSLRIVLEHISTSESVDKVLSFGSLVGATITAHHLSITLDDVIGDRLEPHNFCKPIPKHPRDRQRLLEAAISGSPKFFLGSDSAPHPVEDKECSCGAAGVYSAPVLLPLLAEIFEKLDALDKLECFTSVHGAGFYQLPLNQEFIELEKRPFLIDDKDSGVTRPFLAGSTISWSLVN